MISRLLGKLQRKGSVGPMITAADRAMAAGQWQTAIDTYEGILALRPGLWHLRVQLGHALKEHGERARAEAQYLLAATAAPEDADVRMHLGHLCRQRGDDAAARQWFESADTLTRGKTPTSALAATRPDANGERRHLAAPSAPPHDLTLYWNQGSRRSGQASGSFDEVGEWSAHLARLAAQGLRVVPVGFDAARGEWRTLDAEKDTARPFAAASPALFVTHAPAGGSTCDSLRMAAAAQTAFAAPILLLDRGPPTGTAGASLARHRHEVWRRAAAATIGLHATHAGARPGSPVRPHHCPDFAANGTPSRRVASSSAARAGLLVVLPSVAESARVDDRLRRLGGTFATRRAVALGAPGPADSDAHARFMEAHALSPLDRETAWQMLHHGDFGTVLLPAHEPLADLWGEAAHEAGARVLADLHDGAVFEVLGGQAGYWPDEQTQAPADAPPPHHPPKDLATPWLDALTLAAAELTHDARPVGWLNEPTIGQAYSLVGALPGAADGRAFLAGPGWQETADGVQARTADGSRLTAVTDCATPGKLVCRACVAVRRSGAADAAVERLWATLDPVLGEERDGRHRSIHYPLDQLRTRSADRDAVVEVRGFVFFLADQDHPWFEFLDRVSRRTAPDFWNWQWS